MAYTSGKPRKKRTKRVAKPLSSLIQLVLVEGIMRALIILLLLSQSACVCMAGCAIEPDNNGHVTIPNRWREIRFGAFEGCSALQSVTIGDSVTSIGVCIFQLQYIGVHNYT